MDKLYQRINKKNSIYKFMDETEIHFVFWAYQQLEIQLGDQIFKTLFGVPQGGINSPILFDWTLYFLMEDLQSLLNHLRDSGIGDQCINEENTFLFADDSAFGFRLCTPEANHKTFFKSFLHRLCTTSLEWGLKINWDKSALMKFSLVSGTCHLLSDYPAPWKGRPDYPWISQRTNLSN